METTKSNFSEREELKSFDVLSSINLYKYDLETFGRILPETKQRVYDEELSYIAEGINRPNYKEFVLAADDGQLVYFHEGSWQPYMSTLMLGLEAAKAEARSDYRKSFEIERRADDLARGYQIQNLQPGEKIVWHYDFPYEQLKMYGQKFLGDMGFQPARKMGYLCEAEKMSNGEVIIRHQSVDNSDAEAYAAAMEVGQAGGSIDDMREAYDHFLQQKNSANFYAGRRVNETLEENAWTIIESNRDLIEDYFMQQVELLAIQNLPIHELERAKKRLTYGVWGAIKERLDRNISISHQPESFGFEAIHHEVQTAYSALSARGETLFGCGGSISGEEALATISSKDVFESIFGKKMSCPFCGATQYGDPCSPNQFCSECTAEVVNGRVKSKGNGGKKNKNAKKQPDFFEVISMELARYERERKQRKELKKAA